jgi:hypothetical protein
VFDRIVAIGSGPLEHRLDGIGGPRPIEDTDAQVELKRDGQGVEPRSKIANRGRNGDLEVLAHSSGQKKTRRPLSGRRVRWVLAKNVQGTNTQTRPAGRIRHMVVRMMVVIPGITHRL